MPRTQERRRGSLTGPGRGLWKNLACLWEVHSRCSHLVPLQVNCML